MESARENCRHTATARSREILHPSHQRISLTILLNPSPNSAPVKYVSSNPRSESVFSIAQQACKRLHRLPRPESAHCLSVLRKLHGISVKCSSRRSEVQINRADVLGLRTYQAAVSELFKAMCSPAEHS